jgi:hypothetical protein
MYTKKHIILLVSCIAVFLGAYWAYPRHTPVDYVAMADAITADVAEKLTERYPMQVIGVSGGMMNTVNTIGLHFQIRGPITKERLREMLVDSVEEFLTSINANEEIRPFLKNYPFTEKEIDIVIFIVDGLGIHVYDPDPAVAAAAHGKICYYTEDKNNEFGYKQKIKEDYQTALQIVRESKQH